MSDHVLVERRGPVMELRLNRPEKRNALTVEMYAALAGALEESESDSEVRVILLSGEGAGFTAGNDLRDFLARPPTGDESPVHRFLNGLVTGSKPLLAAVQGFAVGIGTTMLLHCDLVYAATGTRFHLPFVTLGLVPEAASSLLLPDRVGAGRAAEMLLMGEPLSAEEALAAGWISRVYPPETLLQEVRARADRMAKLPPDAVRATRRLMRSDQSRITERMRIEGKEFAERLRSAEAREAMEAFFARG